MKHKGRLSGIAGALGMLVLILDSKTAISGGREGLELCIRTVIPSLFPFFVLAPLLTGSLMGRNIRALRPIGRLTGIPEGAESILLTGLLGGYPIGARSIAAARKRGQLSSRDGARMMAFCNNAGPPFLFGIAGAMFPQKWVGWALWGIHIISAVIVGAMLPGGSRERVKVDGADGTSLPAAVSSAVRSMAGVCGWVVLFRVLMAFLDRWCLWLVPEGARAVVYGILELTNGCCSLGQIGNPGLRFVICSGLLAFGGLCVTMQTVSAAEGVGMQCYLPGKLLHSLVSILLALSVQVLFSQGTGLAVTPLLPLGGLAILLLLRFLPVKREKISSIPAEVGV